MRKRDQLGSGHNKPDERGWRLGREAVVSDPILDEDTVIRIP